MLSKETKRRVAMKVKLTNMIVVALLLFGCTTAQSDRAYFCFFDGSRLNDAFVIANITFLSSATLL